MPIALVVRLGVEILYGMFLQCHDCTKLLFVVCAIWMYVCTFERLRVFVEILGILTSIGNPNHLES